MSEYKLDDFDFGFTAVSEDELDVYQQTQNELKSTLTDVEAWKDKAITIHNAIQPLLDNLALSPEKDYILWPNRVEKIEQFKLKLKSILES